jgi:hypothetical protein
MSTAVRPAKTSPGPWDAFADVDAFVDEVLAELLQTSPLSLQSRTARNRATVARTLISLGVKLRRGYPHCGHLCRT